MSKLSAALDALCIGILCLTVSAAFWIWHDSPQAVGVSLPQGAAVFETSLQSRISSTDTSMTLVANSVRGGTSLSGYNCFTIDEGRTDMEYVCGTVAGTSVTSLERGIDPLTASTTNSTLKFSHRVGANVKITDFPLIQRMRHQLSGSDTVLNVLKYDASTPDCASTNEICDYGFITGLAFSGASVLNASTVAKGVVEIATQIEAASSTSAGGSGALLVIPASSATSTCNGITSPLRALFSDNTGFLDDDCFPSTIAKALNFANFEASATSSATIGDFPAWHIGKQMQVFSSTGTTTFTVPSGISKIQVEVQAGGAAGGGCSAAGSASASGGGGGAGGYAFENVNLVATTTIQVFVGAAAQWSTFGTNGFYLSASPGVAPTTEGPGGAGGVGSGGDINLSGQGGGGGSAEVSSNSAANQGGVGGRAYLGGGGAGGMSSVGGDSGNYGGGGGGAGCGSGQTTAGGAGAQGVVIVRW